LAGCGQRPADDTAADTEEAALTIDWKTKGFAVSGEPEVKEELWAREYLPWTHDNVTYDREKEAVLYVLEGGCHDDVLYRVYLIYEPPIAVATKWILERYDLDTMQSTFSEITNQQLGIEESGYLTDIEVLGADSFIFQAISYGRNEDDQVVQESNCFLYTDLQSPPVKRELLPVYLEMGIVPEAQESIMLQDPTGECICDGQGNSYVRKAVGNNPWAQLYIINSDCQVQMEYPGSVQEEIHDPFRTAEGELVFPVYNREEYCTRFVWFDAANQKAQELARLEKESVTKVYGMEGNNIYYEAREGVVQWDIETGERKQIFSFLENGVSSVYEKELFLRDGQPPVLRMYGTINRKEEDWFVLLSQEKVERAEAVRIAGLEKTPDIVAESVFEAGRINPNYDYAYEAGPSGGEEEYRTRILAEISAGKGPDILYVSREDMELLSGKGALADLRTYVSDSTLQQLVPGAIEYGTTGNMLAGIPTDIWAETIWISESVWDEETWSLEDVIGLMESGKLDKRLCQFDLFYAPVAELLGLVMADLESSFLIDWENRECHFRDERFLRLLEYTKEGAETAVTYTDLAMTEGSNLMSEYRLSSIDNIEYFRGTKLPEGSNLAGLPTGRGNGNFLGSDGLLVVNKNAVNKDAVSNYLECVLGEEMQFGGYRDALPVRRMSVDRIRYIEETGEARAYGRELIVFDDGTTSLHEVIRFLDSCVALPREYPVIQQIIYEEAPAYYNGDKSAEDTAETINRRVQMYLDENNP